MNVSIKLGRTEENLLDYLECCDVLFVLKVQHFLYVQSSAPCVNLGTDNLLEEVPVPSVPSNRVCSKINII